MKALRRYTFATAVLGVLFCGCPETSRLATDGGPSSEPTVRDDAGRIPADDAAAPATVIVDRGPTVLAIEGDPNGLLWDAGTNALYIADDNGNRILKWTDSGSFSKIADLPKGAAEGAGLGQLVRTGDGSIVVTRFGYGTVGDVVVVSPAGVPSIVPNLDPIRRRIGLAVTSDGRLFDTWFVRMASGARAGSVGELSIAGAEPEVITGLKKPVGVIAVSDSLYVSDQDLGQILKAPIASPASYTVFATVVTPDLLAAGPSGSLFVGGGGGNLYRVSSTGAATIFKSGFQTVRGVAYDAKNRRVFVADHDDDESNGSTHTIHMLPVD